jgi:SAM-dependent methyltransferase
VLTSKFCTQADLESTYHAQWCERIKETPRMHRKQWEFSFIAQALQERGLLRKGTRGVVFGAGQEPLPAAFAARGVEVLVTDLDEERATAQGWATTGQHVDQKNLAHLNDRGICSPAKFDRLVGYRMVDMNAVPDDIAGYDFCWSSCSLEHLGSLRAGERFIERSLACLKPGGVAVHTTEFTLSSNDQTLETGGTVLYRRKDIEALIRRLEHAGHTVATMDWSVGDRPLDRHVDVAPYSTDRHLRLEIAGHACTSIGLIITKGALPSINCHHNDFHSWWFDRWKEVHFPGFVRHRKDWEWSFILQALDERGYIKEGARGLAFAVGQERLPAALARRGCLITATDQDLDGASVGAFTWNGHYAGNLDGLIYPAILDPATTRERVTFAFADMTAIPETLRDFDFCWSSCSLEHLGAPEVGIEFIRRSLDTLRPGGLAVHTTDLNVDGDETVPTFGFMGYQSVIYGQAMLRDLVAELAAEGHEVAPLVLGRGPDPVDLLTPGEPWPAVDLVNYRLEGHAAGSVGLIVRKRA